MLHLSFRQLATFILEIEDIRGYDFTARSTFADLTGGNFGKNAFFTTTFASFGHLVSVEPDSDGEEEAKRVWSDVGNRLRNKKIASRI